MRQVSPTEILRARKVVAWEIRFTGVDVGITLLCMHVGVLVPYKLPSETRNMRKSSLEKGTRAAHGRADQ